MFIQFMKEVNGTLRLTSVWADEGDTERTVLYTMISRKVYLGVVMVSEARLVDHKK